MKIDKDIVGKRICLRNYIESDLTFLTDMWFDEENGKYMSDPTREYVDETFQKALDTLGASQYGYYLVIKLADTKERIGSFCMFPDEGKKTYSIGYCIHKDYWKQGYGSEALALVLEWLKEQGAEKVTAEVAVENIPSNMLLRKLGFEAEKESEFKKYNMDVRFDSYIYALCFPKTTTVNCVWEHNGNDALLYAVDFVGAYTRGESLEVAIVKMPGEIASYLKWLGEDASEKIKVEIIEEKESDLNIKDADSDVIFEGEKAPLTTEEYEKLKALALQSAKDFLALYESIPDKNASAVPARKTFYGDVPRTAREMYEHTKNVNEYYFAEIEVHADNDGDIYECRRRGFEALEARPHFLQNPVIEGSYGEEWSLRKVLRRFVWHDRIHARAMYRMALKMFSAEHIPNVFFFN